MRSDIRNMCMSKRKRLIYYYYYYSYYYYYCCCCCCYYHYYYYYYCRYQPNFPIDCTHPVVPTQANSVEISAFSRNCV